MSERHARRPRHVPALGVRGHHALRLPHPLHDESGRHDAARLLRQRLLLAERALQRAPLSGRSRLLHGHRHGAPRAAPLRRARALRRQQGAQAGGRRRPAFHRARQGRRTRRAGPPRGLFVAEVLPPVAALPELRPRRGASDGEGRLGTLPRGCLRQPHADRGGGGPCLLRTDAVAEGPRSARPRLQGRAEGEDGPDEGDGRLRRPRTQGRAARHGEGAAPLHLLLRLPLDGRRDRPSRTGWSVGHQAHPRHGARGGGRLGVLQGARQPARLDPAPGREGPRTAAHAQLDAGDARRDGELQRLPRGEPGERRPEPPPARDGASRPRDQAVVRSRARL